MAGEVQVQINAPELAAIHAAFRDIGDRTLMAAYRQAVRKAAEPLAQEIRVRYSQFSTRIPQAVRIKLKRGGRLVVIEVGGTKATPHARTIEGLPSGGPARHPVFAKGPRDSWAWVAQTPPRQIVAKVVAAGSDRFVYDVVRELMQALDRDLNRSRALALF